MKKRILSLLLTLCLVCSLLPGTALAASDKATEAADALYELGLFSGTGTDANGKPVYDLDRAPTRQESIVMLVRLLGKVDEATNGSWTTPFTDVADWAKPYVGYAYTNGLAFGVSETSFGSGDTVSASQYLTFVLRALGYESGTDFQWDKAWELSDKIGMTNGEYNSTSSFLRGDVAIVSSNALYTNKKGTTTPLIDTLSISHAELPDLTGSEDSSDPVEQPVDYSYLAVNDFVSIKNTYSNATPIIAYQTQYTNLDGELCVITDVRYKIISDYNHCTLYNASTGSILNNPTDEFKTQINRTYGTEKLHYLNLYQEFLTHYAQALQGKEGKTIDLSALS